MACLWRTYPLLSPADGCRDGEMYAAEGAVVVVDTEEAGGGKITNQAGLDDRGRELEEAMTSCRGNL